jgi:ATP-dependent Lhr-like helicase
VAYVPELEEEHFLILAGRRWQILDIDHERKTISVKPSPGGRAPDFHSRQGIEIHPRVRAAMKSLLASGTLPQYLDMRAREMLSQARATAAQSGLLRIPFIQDGPDTIWFTWTGTKIQRTLLGLGAHFGGLKVIDERVALVFEKVSLAQVLETYRDFLTECPDAVSLAMQFPHRIVEKYDRYLSGDLTAELFARERLDLSGALNKIREINA